MRVIPFRGTIQRCCAETTVYDRDVSGEAALFKALADPARFAILATLARAEHEVCVCDFTSGLVLDGSNVLHHLKLLKDAGLVTSVRRGTWGYLNEARARLTPFFPESSPREKAEGFAHLRSAVSLAFDPAGKREPIVQPRRFERV